MRYAPPAALLAPNEVAAFLLGAPAASARQHLRPEGDTYPTHHRGAERPTGPLLRVATGARVRPPHAPTIKPHPTEPGATVAIVNEPIAHPHWVVGNLDPSLHPRVWIKPVATESGESGKDPSRVGKIHLPFQFADPHRADLSRCKVAILGVQIDLTRDPMRELPRDREGVVQLWRLRHATGIFDLGFGGRLGERPGVGPMDYRRDLGGLTEAAYRSAALEPSARRTAGGKSMGHADLWPGRKSGQAPLAHLYGFTSLGGHHFGDRSGSPLPLETAGGDCEPYDLSAGLAGSVEVQHVTCGRSGRTRAEVTFLAAPGDSDADAGLVETTEWGYDTAAVLIKGSVQGAVAALPAALQAQLRGRVFTRGGLDERLCGPHPAIAGGPPPPPRGQGARPHVLVTSWVRVFRLLGEEGERVYPEIKAWRQPQARGWERPPVAPPEEGASEAFHPDIGPDGGVCVTWSGMPFVKRARADGVFTFEASSSQLYMCRVQLCDSYLVRDSQSSLIFDSNLVYKNFLHGPLLLLL